MWCNVQTVDTDGAWQNTLANAANNRRGVMSIKEM